MKIDTCKKASFTVIGKEGAATQYLEDNHIALAGAVHDFICPQTGKEYMFFPIKKL